MRKSVARLLIAAAVSIALAQHSIAAESLIGKVAAERTAGGLNIVGTIQKVPPAEQKTGQATLFGARCTLSA
jgi:hypothetical protein